MAESATGVDGFRFWDYPVEMPQTRQDTGKVGNSWKSLYGGAVQEDSARTRAGPPDVGQSAMGVTEGAR